MTGDAGVTVVHDREEGGRGVTGDAGVTVVHDRGGGE